jgi:hypothetical protein
LRAAGERIVGFLLDIAASVILLSAFAWLFVVFYPSSIGVHIVDDVPTLLSYFGTLWTIQATLAALVYPIVISFVAVLLRKRATATLGLRIYSLDAAVIPAGSSSIALVGWMGLQYLAMPFLTPEWIAAATIGDGAWFILNAFLTSHFLYRTIRFLNDDDRLEVFKRFAVHVALPRDLRTHLMGIILQSAQDRKLLPGAMYSHDEAGPQILMYPMAMGTACVSLTVRQERVVADIRLRLLAWGIRLWLRTARHEKPKSSIAGLRPEYPLLQIAVHPGQTVEREVTVCRYVGSTKPNALARYLIRRSIVLKPPAARNVAFSSLDILEEIATETLELIEQFRYEAALRMLNMLAEVHAVLIRSAAFINDHGQQDNAVLLPDPYGLASRRIHERWLDCYDELAQLAVSTLPSTSKPFEHHCSLAERLVFSLRHEHTDIVTHLMRIPGYLMFRLGSWWSDRVEERGAARHDHVHGVTLPLPLGRTYENAIQTFVGYWERLDLWESNEERERSEDWPALTRRARFAIAHVEHSVNMLLEAVLRGDITASLWLADSLVRWWNSRRYHFGELDPYNLENPRINASCLTKDWSGVKSLIGIPDGDDDNTRASDLVATILNRYWSDMRLVAALILIGWLPTGVPEDALCLRIATFLLKGKGLKEGGDGDASPIDSRQLVVQLLRMQLLDEGYSALFDKIVMNARQLRRARMVPGRIYVSSGADDLQSLICAQALLLVSITRYREQFPSIEEFERSWSENFRRSERAERYFRQLHSSFDDDKYKLKRPSAEAIRRSLGIPIDLTNTEARVRRSARRLADRIVATRNRIIGAASVSQARLDALGKEISAYILGNTHDEFPFVLKSKLRAETIPTNARRLTFSGVSKLPYTEPLLEPGASLESSAFRDWVASRIASGIVLDYLSAQDVKPLRTDSESHFLEDIQSAGQMLQSNGLTPLLLLPRYNAPECASAWRYIRRTESGESNIPVRLRGPDDAPGVTSFFHGIPAYQAPIARSCYVVARQDFEIIEYQPRFEGSCVGVSAVATSNDKIDLTFEWVFRSAAIDR